MNHDKETMVRFFPGFRLVMSITITVLAISGFGQMPIFKRYYIADIPGLAFLAKFYITHYLHYLSAIVFLVLCAYAISMYFLYFRKRVSLTIGARVKLLWYALLLASGSFLIIRNLPGIYQPHVLISVMDLIHMSAAVFLGVTAIGFKFGSGRWVKHRGE